MSDDNLFREQMGDIKPIAQDKVRKVKKTETAYSSLAARRDAAETERAPEDYLSEHIIRELGPHDIISYKRPGVQEGVFKKLRLGKYAADAQLDLHKMNVETARKAVFQFIADSMAYDLRVIMIVHGKAAKKQGKSSTLKSYAAHWLEEIPEVLAYHSAQPHHGGAGALYVLLKKSEKAKQRNREKHSR